MQHTMDGITSIAPEEISKLIRQFIQKKNVNDRVSIRLRIKAILDFLSTDTEFPPNPLKEEPKLGSARHGAITIEGMGGGASYAANDAQAQAQPQRLDNGDILG